jgi:chemotaxis protein MotB
MFKTNDKRKEVNLHKKQKHKQDDHLNPDRYLITYADLVTLLLGLFVILYAISRIDEIKYKEFASAFADYFKPTTLKGGTGELSGRREGIPDPIFYARPSTKSLEEIATQTENAFKDYINKGDLQVKLTSEGVQITLREKLLFESAKAEIQPLGKILLDSLASILAGINYQVSVDGHTDSDPIRNYRYESNWHLSCARAANVGYSLVCNGVPENNLIVRGFGAQRPVSDNISSEGKAQNRRVEITISELSRNSPSVEGYKNGDSTKISNY